MNIVRNKYKLGRNLIGNKYVTDVQCSVRGNKGSIYFEVETMGDDIEVLDEKGLVKTTIFNFEYRGGYRFGREKIKGLSKKIICFSIYEFHTDSEEKSYKNYEEKLKTFVGKKSEIIKDLKRRTERDREEYIKSL